MDSKLILLWVLLSIGHAIHLMEGYLKFINLIKIYLYYACIIKYFVLYFIY